MILQKNINYKGKDYSAITDDTRLVESLDSILLVKTKRNAHFITQSDNIIESRNLNEIFCIAPSDKPMKIIGITGTNGKTTTAAIIYSLLLDLNYRVGLLGTRGFFVNEKRIKPKGLTTPSVLELYENLEIAAMECCDFFVMEVSSHAIEQERIAGIDFALRILSNITSDHLDYHKSIEEYRRIKNQFFATSESKLINLDESYADFNPTNAFTYGIEHKGYLSVDAYALENGIDAHLSWKYQQEVETTTIDTHLYGKHNLYNILAAMGAVKILTSARLNAIAQALEHFGGVSGRMEIIHQNPLVIVDFAHTEDGMRQIFESFKRQKIAVVFGAGGDRDRSKRARMGACAREFAHKIYVTSDNPRNENPQDIISEILSGIDNKQNVFVESDRKKAILSALENLESNEVLLILGKGDEDYQIIGNEKIHFDDREIVRNFFK
ncbi:UDP-N-acetylmuramoyl-L-alanyl-D-glutamate--2,6-diaminopimelate ligase [Helicobacter sp. MIT 05-5293]|uniref:UDP-N-acetylmuramoyl-L-alanyl-D-glutamate--2, 6-diaminopimelate ligase n=1 Tax=Helicobacter sp. MIT 05-5293 TaxID=1548149 RepID=UPI00051D4E00|nr:UDP-N-acetylmuramoyl-L-alanyl-D-glutamate--2,6-diaminopimelate ligase [Helicobacter sp. MIT 05-5293]TLD82185.1 UDP-N-acetylmuramoyl-L-alanyl-D-glutamate--2,6-diaminopimelate ligase [Helicobacter sp. MIT 05-5293]